MSHSEQTPVSLSEPVPDLARLDIEESYNALNEAVDDPDTITNLAKKKLVVKRVSWTDSDRSVNSCSGNSIVDLSVITKKDGKQIGKCPMAKADNFKDPVWECSASDVKIECYTKSTGNNETVTLEQLLGSDFVNIFPQVTANSEKTLFNETLDNNCIVGGQTNIIPVSTTDSKGTEISFGVYTYGTPYLSILVTPFGTSVCLCKGRSKEILFVDGETGHNHDMIFNSITNVRHAKKQKVLETDAPPLVVDKEDMTEDEKNLQKVMLIMIPLKAVSVTKGICNDDDDDDSDYYGGDPFTSKSISVCRKVKKQTAIVQPALMCKGKQRKEALKIDLSTYVRANYRIRIQVVESVTTQNGVMSDEVAEQLEKIVFNKNREQFIMSGGRYSKTEKISSVPKVDIDTVWFMKFLDEHLDLISEIGSVRSFDVFRENKDELQKSDDPVGMLTKLLTPIVPLPSTAKVNHPF